MKKFFSLLSFCVMVVLLQVSFIFGEDGSLSAIIKLQKGIEDVTFTDVLGKQKKLSEVKGASATIVVFLNFQCPISNKIVPELVEIADQYKNKKVKVIGVCCDVESPQELEKHIAEFKITFPVFYDPQHILSTKFLADFTPQAYLIDSAMTLRYVGGINDQYEDRATKNLVVKNHFLKTALNSVLANKDFIPTYTQPVGCPLDRVKKIVVENNEATYYRDVLPILQNHCQVCHRKGEVAPFPLVTYDDASLWAELIRDNVAGGIMPPWKPTAASIPLLHDARLPKKEIETINNWYEKGLAKGNEKDAPAPIKFKPTNAWDGDTPPDLIIEVPETFHLAAKGDDHYRTMVMPFNNKEPLYIRKSQFIPGNPRIVHHALYFYDGSGIVLDAQNRMETRKPPENGADADWGFGYNSGMGLGFIPNPNNIKRNKDNPGSSFGGWVPAIDPLEAPKGTAWIIPPDSNIFFQIHYHRTGKQETDRSKIGIWLNKQPPTKFLGSSLVDTKFTIIPAGSKKFKSTGTKEVMVDSYCYTISPHAHMTAEEMRLWYTLPGKSEKILLLEIKNWDFNWQQRYYPEKQIFMPKGTIISTEWIYNNSNSNNSNPFHPPKPLFLGESTLDEMGFSIVGLVIDKPSFAPKDLFTYFERLLKAEALKKLLGGN